MTAQREIPRKAWNPREAGKALGIGYKATLALIHSGELGHVKCGQYYLVPDAELVRYLDENTKSGVA